MWKPWHREHKRSGTPTVEAVEALHEAEMANQNLDDRTGPIERIVDRLDEIRVDNHIGPAVQAAFKRRRR